MSGSPVSTEAEKGQSKHQDQVVEKPFWRPKLVTEFSAGHATVWMLVCSGHALQAFDAHLLMVHPIWWQMLCICILLMLLSVYYGLCYVVHRFMFNIVDCGCLILSTVNCTLTVCNEFTFVAAVQGELFEQALYTIWGVRIALPLEQGFQGNTQQQLPMMTTRCHYCHSNSYLKTPCWVSFDISENVNVALRMSSMTHLFKQLYK